MVGGAFGVCVQQRHHNVEIFNNLTGITMATVNFSVPDDVKAAFNAAFATQNKSAIIAALMREAVERVQRKQRHRQAIEQILSAHATAPQVSEAQFHAARDEGRP
jgi:rRNA-processing protein FCF1